MASEAERGIVERREGAGWIALNRPGRIDAIADKPNRAIGMRTEGKRQ